MTHTNNTFMVQADLMTLQSEQILDRITHKLLLNLFARGNTNAYDIMIGRNNGLVTLEDLTQNLYLYLLEHSEDWYISRSFHRYSTDEARYSLIFLDEFTSRGFYGVVSKTLYQNIRKHDHKSLWIELDGEQVRVDDISTLASHTTIDDVMTLSLFNQFSSYLLSTRPKQYSRYMQAIELRLKGYKYSEIATTLNIKESSVKMDFQKLRELWHEFTR